jgi:hypothetical protein
MLCTGWEDSHNLFDLAVKGHVSETMDGLGAKLLVFYLLANGIFHLLKGVSKIQEHGPSSCASESLEMGFPTDPLKFLYRNDIILLIFPVKGYRSTFHTRRIVTETDSVLSELYLTPPNSQWLLFGMHRRATVIGSRCDESPGGYTHGRRQGTVRKLKRSILSLNL